ncbi:aminopeptidase P family protein [Oceanimonas smirnovii]|uniref:aminopeptidase P family protein n=1 Tax=Oceanimonas smirnovii TaxID=264574 RepID=UPI0003745712|nr:aminopeptidase P family protein [Oceanimonas smirnovii]
MTHAQRLASVRHDLQQQQLDAFIVPHDDEHLGEYIPPYAERLHWLTGFTGSAGAAVVLARKAAVFVDGRYTVQVRHQCDASLFEYRHLIEQPVLDYVLSELNTGARVGFDPRLHSRSWFDAAQQKLAARGLQLVPVKHNPVDRHWHNRPEPTINPALLLSQEYSGQHSEAKRNRIAEQLAAGNIDAQLLTQAEPINWLLNIRGRDIPCLPAVLSFALLHKDGSVQLFAEPAKFEGLDLTAHCGHNVTLAPFNALEQALTKLGNKGARVQLDPATANAWSSLVLEQAGAKIVFADDPCMLPKACKNPVEVQGSRAAHLRDGVAVCRFLAWLDRRLEQPAPEREDEGTLADKLLALRAEHADFVEPSFSTISALGPNAAMCHYHHDNGTPRKLGQDAIYLVDSGGQYLDGTTDITRTVAVGEPDDEMRKLFTLVLRGHIDLACARFPAGTGGLQLDALARMPLWQQGYNFDHGTGHGVGHYLSVHEGPQRISPKGSTVPLTTGMIVSNEPGYYRENAFGIRCENLEVVQPADTSGDIPVFEFENLTWVPFDRRLIDSTWLEPKHIEWLNDYHANVWEKISPQLEGEDLTWLEQATRPL